jgi:flagellar motility protein MotE (MotC chaperone)
MNPTEDRNRTGLLQQPGQGFPLQQQQPSALQRTINLMSRAGGMTIVATVVVFGLQAVMPAGSKPSDLIGAFHGGTTAATLNAERGAQVDTAQQMADAQARATIEVETARQQQAAILQSLQAKQDMANLADYACTGGGFVALFMSPTDAQAMREAAQAGCEGAAKLRREILQQQAEAARLGAIMQRMPTLAGR